jgi:hypothetical protein
MINPSLRASKHTIYAPGLDDGSHGCARACGRQHLGRLRAFSVTGTHWVRESPPPPPGPPPTPPPPFPPFAPFSECQDTCSFGTVPDHRKHQCRDGGYGAHYPTLCFYSTSCITCGPRSDQSDHVYQDNNCASARNGVCEDGGTGSSYYIDIDGEQAHLCGYGTECASSYSNSLCWQSSPHLCTSAPLHLCTSETLSTSQFDLFLDPSNPAPSIGKVQEKIELEN